MKKIACHFHEENMLLVHPEWFRYCTKFKLSKIVPGKDIVLTGSDISEMRMVITEGGSSYIRMVSNGVEYTVRRHLSMHQDDWNNLVRWVTTGWSRKDPDWMYYINDGVRYKRRIVCAANKIGDYIVPGARHGSPLMNTLVKQLFPNEADAIAAMNECYEEGFIDQYDQWWNREQALEIAINSDQIIRKGGSKKMLWSENLY